MVPLRFVFRSRWWALAWAAGICWSAVSFVSSQDDKAGGSGTAVQADDVDALLNAL